jgi:hypothetical protein
MICTATTDRTRSNSISAYLKITAYACLAILLGATTGHAGSAPPQPAAEEAHQVAAARRARIAVIGDSLAFELWKGLHGATRGDKSVEVVKFTRVSTGLMRRDVFDWNRGIRDFVRSNSFDIAVVVLGGNDRQTVWVKGRRLNRGSQPWLREYAGRASGFMKTLRSAGKPVYWIGLPIVRSAPMARDYRKLNALFRDLAGRHGIHYVDTWKAFADANGGYTSYGRDGRGARRIMRSNDGLHFSNYGRRKFGDLVFQHLRRALRGGGAS